MVKNYFISLCALMMIFSTIKGEIIETAEIESIHPYINEDTLVFLNVSNVLYQHNSSLAYQAFRDYFNERVYELIGKGEKTENLINKVRTLLVTKLSKKCVDIKTPSLIADLQSKGILVSAITERRAVTPYAENNAEIVEGYLNSLGIVLSKNFDFGLETSLYTFHHGILFTNRHPAGEAMLWLLQKYPKSRVIVVDDSKRSLNDAETTFKNTNIEFIGFRYSAADNSKEQVDIELGIIEFFSLINDNIEITDDEALNLKSKYNSLKEDLDRTILDPEFYQFLVNH